MIQTVNSSEIAIVARLTELLVDQTPWQRTLWSVGTVFAIDELVDAVAAMDAGTLSEGSVQRMIASCKRLFGKDPVLSKQEKSTLAELLRHTPRAGGLAFHGCREVRNTVARDYLTRYQQRLAAGTLATAESVERVSRSIAAHLLDSGLSQQYLERWIREKTSDTTPAMSLGELCEAGQAIVDAPQSQFEILVAFKNAPSSASGYPPGWLNSQELVRWLRREGFPTTEVRASGGLALAVEAKDAHAAVDAAISLVDGYCARSAVGKHPVNPS